jgi:hypothetical protein
MKTNESLSNEIAARALAGRILTERELFDLLNNPSWQSDARYIENCLKQEYVVKG